MLVGRDAELAEVERLLHRAAGGAGGVLVFIGPARVGKTAVLDAASALAAGAGFEVVRTCPPSRPSGRLIWAQLLQDVGAPRELAVPLFADPTPLDLDAAARALVSKRPRLILVDDIDRGGDECLGFLTVLAPRLAVAPTVVIVASARPLGIGAEMRLRPLREDDLPALVGELPAEARRALWIASRGLPGVARSLATALRALPSDQPAVVYLALHAVSQGAFLEVDAALLRLLEMALNQTGDDATRARLLARLAAELLGDASAAARRRAAADEALDLARRIGDPQVLAEVLDARLHALWDPQSAEDRLAAGSEIADLARASGDQSREHRGLFWRFVALMELGRVAEAESALAAFEREVELAGDSEAVVMVMARHAMLDILRGRFDEATRQTEEVFDQAGRIGLPDAVNIRNALTIAVACERDVDVAREMLERVMPTVQHRLPGHFYEANAARGLAGLGRLDQAAAELDRVLPHVLAGSGPRWIGAMADVASAAAVLGDEAAAASIYEALSPYRGRLVVYSGAATVWGPVDHYLGLLATTLGRHGEAVDCFTDAIALEERIGALPYLAHSLAGAASAYEARGAAGDLDLARASRERARSIAERLGMTGLLGQLAPRDDEWILDREGEDWILQAGDERARLRDGRGLHYLRALVASPGHDIAALGLVSGAGLVAPATEPVVDDRALAAYRRRLANLADELDAADAAGDAGRAERVQQEREALIDELRRATGLGGRARRASPEAERARVNVTRTLRTTIDHVQAVAPKAAAHLRASLRTGTACRYDPAPGGPARWRV